MSVCAMHCATVELSNAILSSEIKNVYNCYDKVVRSYPRFANLR